MKVIRTFVALLISEDLKRNILRVQEEVKKLAPDVKWVAPENLHVTLKFLGSVPEDVLPRVFAAVEEAVGGRPAFELSVVGLGAFPNPAKARVVWVGIQEGRDELIELARNVDWKLARLGFAREEKEFKAHITIGRARMGKFVKGLAGAIESAGARDLGRQQVVSVTVMQSDLQPTGPTYTPLKVAELS